MRQGNRSGYKKKIEGLLKEIFYAIAGLEYLARLIKL